MGTVTAHPAKSFSELVDQTVRQPAALVLSRAELFALPEPDQNKAKASSYLVPAIFKSSPSPRQTAHALVCNLIFLDIDEPEEATRLLSVGFADMLGDIAAVVWHTARSTTEAPRLRVMVGCDAVPVARYSQAVNALCGLLGMTEGANRESKVSVQPMYLPVAYRGEADQPLVHDNAHGVPFQLGNFVEDTASQATPKANSDPTLGDLDYLRMPVEGIVVADITEALSKVDADCSMQEWIEVGMGLKHQFGEAGYAMWDDWSSTGEKYVDDNETRTRWDSFSGQPKDRAPVTIRSVIRLASANGWSSRVLTTKLFDGAREWIASPVRSSEELLDQGAKRIAKLSAVIGPLETKVLITGLHKATRANGLMGPTIADLTKEVKRLASESLRANTVAPLWTKGVVYLTAPNVFFRFGDNRKMRPEVVDMIYKSPNPEKSPRDYLIHEVGIPVVENVRYHPASPKRLFVENNCPFINTYRASFTLANNTQEAEAGAMCMAHLDALVGHHWSRQVMDFIAYLVQHSGSKIRYCIAIQSGLGAGKGLLAEIITAMIGTTNVGRIAAEHVIEGIHNSWATGSQLNVLDELRMVGMNRHKPMDKLKPHISDSFISVRNLYEPVQTVPNITNYLIFTNYHDALAVHLEDRRYFYICSPLQNKADIERLGGDTYFTKCYAMCKSHAGGLRSFGENWKISADFNPNGRAPVTPFLKELAEQTASPLSMAVSETISDCPHALVRRDLVSLTALRGNLPNDRLVQYSDQALSAILRELGYNVAGRHMVDGVRHSLYTKDCHGIAAEVAQQRMDLL